MRDRLGGLHSARLVLASVDFADVERLPQDVDRLVAAGADEVILGCAESELLGGTADSPVPLYPTTRLHVEAAVTAALTGVTGLSPR